MTNLQEIFNRIQETKKEQKQIKAMYRDALVGSNAHKDATEELKALKEKKKKIEEAIRDEFKSEFDKLDTLKLDIENDTLLLNDAALSTIMKGETIDIKDVHDNKYEPIFSVRFKKI
ncbi:MAG: hypothetical protein ABH881_00330 [bacterium]